MRPMLLEAGSIVAVAVAVLVSVTTLAVRRSEARGRRRRREAAVGRVLPPGVDGVLAALPTWGGVLVTVVLLARGKLALAAIAAMATVLHAGAMRWRQTR